MKHLLQNHLRLLIMALAPLFLTACGSSDGGIPIDDEHIVCTAPYVPTATITANDIDGKPLANYQVSYNHWPAPSGATNIACSMTSACDLQFTLHNSVVELTVTKKGFQPTKLTVTTPSQKCGSQLTERFTVILKPIA
jgi:hypothetical protein